MHHQVANKLPANRSKLFDNLVPPKQHLQCHSSSRRHCGCGHAPPVRRNTCWVVRLPTGDVLHLPIPYQQQRQCPTKRVRAAQPHFQDGHLCNIFPQRRSRDAQEFVLVRYNNNHGTEGGLEQPGLSTCSGVLVPDRKHHSSRRGGVCRCRE